MAVRDEGIVISASGAAIQPQVLRQVRGSPFTGTDRRFMLVVILSVAAHGTMAWMLRRAKIAPVEVLSIEQIPERFAKLIIEKPIPKAKEEIKRGKEDAARQGGAQEAVSEPTPATGQQASQSGSQVSPVARAAAQKRVAQRVARVEQKIRTVGVLGMLTGVGGTARGAAVVDVLGGVGAKERTQDLDAALSKMGGVVRARSEEIVSSKLVRSKDAVVGTHREEIDNLIAGIGAAKTQDLAKKGNFVIQRPESIEGAAGNQAKRDNDAVNSIVSRNKVSVKMTYEKFLQADPTLSGKITVRFTIAATGSVVRVSIVENTTGNTEFEEEIVRKVKMWKFEAIEDGEVTVTYPFVFTPA